MVSTDGEIINAQMEKLFLVQSLHEKIYFSLICRSWFFRLNVKPMQ